MITLVSGSTRKNSINRAFIQYVSNLLEGRAYEILNLKEYPMFDPDLEVNSVPDVIRDLRKRINKSKVLIISTPEYLHNIPAVLKSFLEWLNGSTNLNEIKVVPIVLTPVEPRGQKSMQALISCLTALGFSISPSMLIHQQELIFSDDSAELLAVSGELQEQLYEIIKNISN